MGLDFLKTCFISCATNDVDARDQIVKKLHNRGIEPYVFPHKKLSPSHMQNHLLIEAIYNQDALVYVKGEISDRSFWVAFERDYAARAGKDVFSFDPISLKIDKSRLPLLQFPIFSIYADDYHKKGASKEDKKKLEELSQFLQNRHIGFIHSTMRPDPSDNVEILRNTFIKILQRNGFILLFLTSRAVESKPLVKELSLALQSYPHNFLIGLVNPLNPKSISHFTEEIHYVQLYGDKKHPEQERWDDLIVHLYWLMLCNSFEVI